MKLPKIFLTILLVVSAKSSQNGMIIQESYEEDKGSPSNDGTTIHCKCAKKVSHSNQGTEVIVGIAHTQILEPSDGNPPDKNPENITPSWKSFEFTTQLEEISVNEDKCFLETDKDDCVNRRTLRRLDMVIGTLIDIIKEILQKIPEMSDNFKISFTHFLNQFIPDITNVITELPEDAMENVIGVSRRALAEAEKYLEMDNFGSLVEEGVSFLQMLDLDTARGLVIDLLQAENMDEPTEEDKNKTQVNMKELITRFLENEQMKPFIRVGLDLSLLAVKKIDPKMARLIAEICAKTWRDHKENNYLLELFTNTTLASITLAWKNNNLNTTDMNDFQAEKINSDLDRKEIEKDIADLLTHVIRLSKAFLSDDVAHSHNFSKDNPYSDHIIDDLLSNEYDVSQNT